MNKFLCFFLRKVLRLEHLLYCLTDCKVELPLHRAYYARRRQQYINYYNKKSNN